MVATIPANVVVTQSPSPPVPKTPLNVKAKHMATLDLFKSPIPIASPSRSRKVHMDPLSPGVVSPKGRKRRRRKIKFNKVVHNRRIPHLNDLTNEEVTATWIQPQDYLEIRSRCVATVKKMMRGGLTKEDCDSGKHCPRGLEAKTKNGSSTRREHKLDSIAAVIEEQTLQWNEDVDDDVAIMEVYSIYTLPCAVYAREAAEEDALEAKAYLHDQRNISASIRSTNPARVSTLGSYSISLLSSINEILHARRTKAALLDDIEKHIFNEAAMERRRSMYDRQSHRGVDLASQLRQYFLSQETRRQEDIDLSYKGGDEHDLPSLAPSQGSDSTLDSQEDIHTFTSQLRNSFHTRRRRSVDLDSIEKSIYEASDELHEEQSTLIHANDISSAIKGFSVVGEVSRIVESRLGTLFGVRAKRRAVVDELKVKSRSSISS